LAGLAVLGVAVALAGCGHSAGPYGATKFTPKYPSFLPQKTLKAHADQVLTGTAGRPALTVEGDGVEVHTARWSVLAEVQGPVVPGEGLPYQTQFTTCTWTITMTQASGPVPIALSDFNTIDHLGHIYRLSFVPGQPRPPSVLGPGRKVTFEMRAYEVIGEGVMRWAPLGQKIVAMWDFEVEND